MRPFLFFLLSVFLVACRLFAHYHDPEILVSSEKRARARLTPKQQRDFDKCYLEAIRQKHKGNTDAAFDLLDAALRINPHASEALYEQALLLIALPFQGDSLLRQRGDQQLLLAHQLEPNNPHYRQTLADHYIQGKKYARAARLYEQMVKEHPRTDNLEVLLRLYQQTQNYTTALSTLDRLEAIEGRNEQSSLRRYAIYKAMGNPTQAYQSIWSLCEEHPQEPRYRVIMGDLYLQNGYPEAALSLYGDVLTSDSSNAMARSSMLNYYYMVDSTELFHQHMQHLMCDSSFSLQQKTGILGHYSREALERRVDKTRLLEHFLEALQCPQPNEMLPQMAAAFVEEAKLPNDSLAPIMRALLRNDPSNERARLQLIQLMIKKDEPQNLLQICREGISHQPRQMLYFYFGGLCYIELQQDEAARDLFAQGVQIAAAQNENDSLVAASLCAALGDLEHQLGNTPKAFAAYERTLAYDPDHVSTLNNYAYFLALSRKNLNKALQMSSRIVEIEPNNPTFLDTHAWVLYQMRRYPQARQYIDQCLQQLETEEEVSSDDANLYEHAGDIYFRCGQLPQALKYWKKAETLTQDKKLRSSLQRKIRRKRL